MTRNPKLQTNDDHGARLSRFILFSLVAWALLHAINIVLVYNLEPSHYALGDNEPIFRYWDAAHYTTITVHGYFSTLWAYYPLYPLLVRILAPAIGLTSRPEIAGAILSACLFIAFCVSQARLVKSDDRPQWITPATVGGWIFLLFSPSSYIFHTNHTESLFLVLSFAAFYKAWKGQWKTAALLAGLCALTRHQGILVAVAIAFHVALQRTDWRDRARVFVTSGLISFLLFALYPLYQYFKTGSPFTFLHVRASWRSVNSLYGWIGTLWYANPWQVPNWRDHLHLLFFLLLWAAAAFLFKKKQYSLALYTLLSTITVLFQGEMVDLFRFGSVIFPALFVLGDLVMRLPRPVQWVLLGAVVWFNLIYTRLYALGEWAY